jgi:hypothetical protein
MSRLADNILEKYFQSHHELIAAEDIDERRVLLSFPVYFSANHRVELAVQQLPSGDFQISDMAQIVAELKLAGVPVGGKTKERIERVAKNANIRFVGNTLVRECTSEQLGEVLHLFADSAKSVGDAYLVHRSRIETEDELRAKVKRVLVVQNQPFKEFEELKGEVESHRVDFFLPPNGLPSLALSVLPRPTRLTAEAWAFKASDMKSINTKLEVGLVYGVEYTKDIPKDIITKKIDIAIPSTDLDALENGLAQIRRKRKLN